MKRLIFSLVVIAAMFAGVSYFQTVIFSQTKPFTLGQILRAISSASDKKVSFEKIVKDVRNQGVDFPLTAETETLLRNEGATDELIKVIRQQSPKLKSNPTSLTTPNPTPMPKPAYAVYLEQGDEYFNKFDFDRAIEQYTKVLEIDPQNVNALIQRGYARHYIGEVDTDFTDYNSAIKIKPDLASDTYMICIHYSAPKDNADVAIENCNKAISAKPDFSLLYYKRALAYRQKGGYENAIYDYTKAIELYPGFYIGYLNRGWAYESKKDYEKAFFDFDKAISLSPNDSRASDALGNLFEKTKAFDKAFIEFNKVILLSPTKSSGYYWRGLAYMNNNDFWRAMTDFDKAVDIDPKFSGAYYGRGIVYLTKSEKDQAIAEFTKAIELSPKFADAYFFRALSYQQKNDYDKAIVDYNKSIEIVPGSYGDYNNRGFCYYSKKDYYRAIEDYNKAIEIDLNNPLTYYNRANLYDKLGQKKLAQEDRDKVKKLEKLIKAKIVFSDKKESLNINTGGFEGTVMDSNNHPLANVTVSFTNARSGRIITRTNSYGRFTLTRNILRSGIYKIVITASGYKTITIEQLVTANSVNLLVPSPKMEPAVTSQPK